MSDLSSDSGSELTGLRKNDSEAWRALYARYGPGIYRLGARMVGRNDADDVVQDTFLTAARKIGQFRGDSAVGTWLYRIAFNTCLKRLQRCRRDKLLHALPLTEGDATTITSDNAEADDVARIENAIQKMKPRYRAILLLRIEGLSYQDICKVMGIKSKASTSQLLNKARAQLRRLLDWPGEGE